MFVSVKAQIGTRLIDSRSNEDTQILHLFTLLQKFLKGQLKKKNGVKLENPYVHHVDPSYIFFRFGVKESRMAVVHLMKAGHWLRRALVETGRK